LRRAAGRRGIGRNGTKFAVCEKRVMKAEKITRRGRGGWKKRNP